MKAHRLPRTFGILLVLVTALMAPRAFAALPLGTITEHVTPAGLVLVPVADWQSAHLVVAGPGELRFEHRFDAGSSIHFPGVGADGEPLPNGVYRYELHLAPPVSDKQSTSERRTGVGHTEPRSRKTSPGATAWGEFRVQDGTLRPIPAPADESGESVGTPPEPSAPSDAGDSPNLVTDKVVEDHFTQDLGTSAEICAGCSASFEPQNEPLTLIGSEPGIRFQDTEESPSRLWEVDVTTSDRFVIEDSDGTDIFNIEANAPANSLYVDESGQVGIGTSTPKGDLHIQSAIFPYIRIHQDASFRTEQEWFVGGNDLAFFIQDGSRGVPFLIQVGAPDDLLVLDSSGSVTIEGGLRVLSTRSRKEAFREVDPADVLGKVLALPITEWQFKGDGTGVRHIGPIAEDFHTAFNLGDDPSYIALTDSAGVALAAIQGLNALMTEKDGRMAKLERQTKEKDARIADLEQMAVEKDARFAMLEERLAVVEAATTVAANSQKLGEPSP